MTAAAGTAIRYQVEGRRPEGCALSRLCSVSYRFVAMPRVGAGIKAKLALGSANAGGASSTALPASCDPALANLTGSELSALANLNLNITLPRTGKSYGGFGEGVCTCARCMRRAGPIREDVE